MALPLFAITLFVSAFILFLVQPMIGKLILPKLGGTPQVWNTCMVFFQTALLAGYAYTHTSSTRLPLRRQLLVHGLLLFVPFIVLFPPIGPFHFGNWTPPLGGNPIFSTLGILTLLVGLPFFVVATSAPLLQKWFVNTGHPAAKDPYFLYGASNLGSLLALLAYPAFIEPNLGLSVQQPVMWTILYGILVALVIACAVLVLKSPASGLTEEPPLIEPPVPPEPIPAAQVTAVRPAPASGISRKKFGKHRTGPAATTAADVATTAEDFEIRSDVMTNWRRTRWVLLAAAPSSLMLGVTTYICTDLSPIPLLWVVPLALYLLTFILVFMRWPVVWIGTPHQAVLFLQPILVLALSMVLIRRGFSPIWPTIIALLAFFLTALVCHGELARDRPKPAHLTEFYLWMSVGGMLGGMFNGLVAPLLFTGVVEFPLAIVLGCLLRPRLKGEGWTDEFLSNSFPNLSASARQRGDELARSLQQSPPQTTYVLNYTLDIVIPLLLGLLTLFLLIFVTQNWVQRLIVAMGFREQLSWTPTIYYLIVGFFPMVLCFLTFARPIRLGLGVGAILAAHLGFQAAHDDRVLYADRSYFGVLRVRESDDQTGVYTSLMHGTTHHGLNYRERKYRRMATTYYHQYGPAGMVMKQYNWFNDGFVGAGPKQWLEDMVKYKSDARMPASLVGLGIGNLGSSALPGAALVGLWSEPPYATIGLGTGTMASYARPFQHCHYYEIDNQIRQLNLPTSGDPYFNYLMDAKARGAEVQVRMGDARLRMAFPYGPYNEEREREGAENGGGPDNFYHMMVVDAFSSDAIPVHLITKEAIEMYFQKLTPDGILCVHTSNRHVDLVPVVEAVARSIKTYGEEGLACYRAHDNAGNASIYGFPGHFTSEWVMLARSPKVLEKLTTPTGYEEKMLADQTKMWTRYGLEARAAEETARKDTYTWKYWVRPQDMIHADVRNGKLVFEAFQPLRYPWTDDYSNVLSVFRWR